MLRTISIRQSCVRSSRLSVRLALTPSLTPSLTRYISNHHPPKLDDSGLFRQQAYVNGQWIDAKDGKTFDVTDPANDKKIGTLPEFTRTETAEAISHALTAFQTFRNTTPRERARILRKWYELCQQHSNDIAKILTWENGKPLAEAKGEVTYGSSFFEWFSEEAPRMYGDVIPSSIKGNRIITIRQPVGVVGIITPWNFPMAMITRKVGAAIAAGCTCVIKPASETPYTALALAELAERAGIPKGVINVVTAHVNTKDVGSELCENPDVRKISFTGSTNVGKLLMKQAAGTMKKISLELGGNAPFIIFDDADVNQAVAGTLASKLRATGQTCVSANRIFVQEGILPKFVEVLKEKMAGYKLGSGFAESTTAGPLIHGGAIKKVLEHVDDAKSKGAQVVLGGEALEGNFMKPTILTNMTPSMRIASEETFGPVAALFPFKDEDEVVKMANSVNVGLAGYLYTKDVSKVWRVAEKMEFGMVGVNTGMISDAAAPFGGIKESGFGREGSKYGIEEYTIIKAITMGGMDLQ